MWTAQQNILTVSNVTSLNDRYVDIREALNILFIQLNYQIFGLVEYHNIR